MVATIRDETRGNETLSLVLTLRTRAQSREKDFPIFLFYFFYDFTYPCTREITASRLSYSSSRYALHRNRRIRDPPVNGPLDERREDARDRIREGRAEELEPI